MQKDSRLVLSCAFIIVLSFMLLLRLFYIQIFRGPFYLKKAKSQWSVSVSDYSKGEVFDRNGEPLTGSYYETYAIISPRWLSNSQKELLVEKGILNPSDDEKPKSIKLSRGNNEIIHELVGKTPGVFVYKKKSAYGPSALATHVVGYKNQTGIEKSFEKLLSNLKVKDTIICDGFGQPIPGAAQQYKEVSAGIKLTIDKKIQAVVEQVMDERVPMGAVVVLDARTGEILSMASRPNYKQYNVGEYLNREDAPLINRAIEAFPPGSIFKIVVLSAALEEGITNLDEKFYCPGFIKVGGNIFKCESYDRGGHGEITLREATARSCNTVFIQLGLRLGKQKIIEYARRFGLGEKVLVDLPEEKPGFIPSIKNVYYQDIGNIAIGQGPILITPIQAAQMLLAIVNDGVLIKPHLTLEQVDTDGSTSLLPFRQERKAVISKKTAEMVRKALQDVTRYGTGVNAMPPASLGESAGKTGTAEIEKNTYHAWFVGYYPARSPRYIISVFLEKGDSGPIKAAPAFRDIIEKLNLHK
ncbi:MAG TPA: penicillin-binding protein 2 [Thermoanaerobacterales bacterium]|nr:penicillin-binding protein 2 [Thermoanaerobacterales bacterium]